MNICGLSRLHCRRCGEETLHRGSNCIHCGTVYLYRLLHQYGLRKAAVRGNAEWRELQ